ncbi:hypothetical protein Dimus_031337 [Dionaea muscipula]
MGKRGRPRKVVMIRGGGSAQAGPLAALKDCGVISPNSTDSAEEEGVSKDVPILEASCLRRTEGLVEQEVICGEVEKGSAQRNAQPYVSAIKKGLAEEDDASNGKVRDRMVAKGPQFASRSLIPVAASWDVVGEEVSSAILEFFANGQLLKVVNTRVVHLVPNVENPSRVSDFM